MKVGVGAEKPHLKYTYAMSDEAVVEEWVENPCRQNFCGGIFFEHRFPIDPSSMTRFRGCLSDQISAATLQYITGICILAGDADRGGISETFLKRIYHLGISNHASLPPLSLGGTCFFNWNLSIVQDDSTSKDSTIRYMGMISM